MKLAHSIYVLCKDQKEEDKLKKICDTYGAYASFSQNHLVGKDCYNLYEVIAFSEKELNLIKKEIDA